MNYPTEEYESYADCDYDFVRRSLPPGLKPFWAVENMSEATSRFSLRTEEWSQVYWDDLYAGILPSDCLQPCLRTEATVVEGEMTRVVSTHNWSEFTLGFSDEVRVKRTSVDSFNFMDSLNFFGSNLGLWPGLGLYQILQLTVGLAITSRVFNRIYISCIKA